MDPLAQYHDSLNAAVVQALQGVTAEVGGLRRDLATQTDMFKGYQTVTMQHSQRIVALEVRADAIERGAGRRRTDALWFLITQAIIGGALAVVILVAALALWRVVALMEAWAR